MSLYPTTPRMSGLRNPVGSQPPCGDAIGQYRTVAAACSKAMKATKATNRVAFGGAATRPVLL